MIRCESVEGEMCYFGLERAIADVREHLPSDVQVALAGILLLSHGMGSEMRKNLARLSRILWSIPEWILQEMPGPLGNRGRYYLWKLRMKSLGKTVTFGRGVRIVGPEWISIGDNTWIDDDVVLLAGPPGKSGCFISFKNNDNYARAIGELWIGKNCHIAQQVVLQAHGGLSIGDNSGVASGARIYTLSHHYRDLTGEAPVDIVFKFTPRANPEEQALIAAPVVLEESTALGLNSVVLPGATIKTGAWVGVLSTVIGEISANSIAGGNPATVLKQIR
jgi:galactoside O-acetyltransferase